MTGVPAVKRQAVLVCLTGPTLIFTGLANPVLALVPHRTQQTVLTGSAVLGITQHATTRLRVTGIDQTRIGRNQTPNHGSGIQYTFSSIAHQPALAFIGGIGHGTIRVRRAVQVCHTLTLAAFALVVVGSGHTVITYRAIRLDFTGTPLFRVAVILGTWVAIVTIPGPSRLALAFLTEIADRTDVSIVTGRVIRQGLDLTHATGSVAVRCFADSMFLALTVIVRLALWLDLLELVRNYGYVLTATDILDSHFHSVNA